MRVRLLLGAALTALVALASWGPIQPLSHPRTILVSAPAIPGHADNPVAASGTRASRQTNDASPPRSGRRTGDHRAATLGSAVPSSRGVDPVSWAEWSRVADCESGGWRILGAAFPDSLGISNLNWWRYGGGDDESPAHQIAVAERIEAMGGAPGYVPDQRGCAAW